MRSLWSFWLLLASSTLIGCATRLALDGSACPCASGWRCCDDQCIRDEDVCAADLVCRDSGPGDATLACVDQAGAICPEGSVCLSVTQVAADGDCCAEATCSDGPRNVATIPRAGTDLVIDGMIDDWATADRYSLLKSPLPSVSQQDLSANFSAKWDESRLYVLVEVRDDILLSRDSDSYYWADDGVELFVDADPRSQATTYSSDYSEAHIFVIQPGQLVDDPKYPLHIWNASDGIVAFGHDDASLRWWFEVGLAWPAAYAPTIRSGLMIGFDVAVNDDDTVDPQPVDDREGQLFWNDATGLSNSNPSDFGVLHLGACPDGP